MKRLPRFFSLLVVLLVPALACQAVGSRLSPSSMIPPPLTEAAQTVSSPEAAVLVPDAALSLSSPSPTPEPAGTPVYTLQPTATTTATPSATPTSTASPSPTATFDPGAVTRQLQVFEELWQIVNEEYLYPDFNGLDWEAVRVEYRARIEAGMSDFDFYLAMDELLYRLGDDHSIFLSPAETIQSNSEYAGGFNYVGIGILNFTVVERRRLVVLLVFPGSSAEVAGIQPHDSIIAVDGEPAVDENGFRTDKLRGPEGSLVNLTIESPEGRQREVLLTRQRVSGPMPVPYEVITTPGGKRVGYVQIVTFNDITVVEQVGAAIQTMTAEGPLDGLILDNRHNSGGANTVLEGVLAYFTQGLVGYFVNRWEQRPLYIQGQDVNGSQQVPLVVLTGADTASFGEVFAGVLQDLGRAYLIGDTTMGNVETLYIYNFSDGSSAWIAHDSFRPANSDPDWETSGVVPDQFAPSDWDLITPGTDPALLSALSFFD